MSDTRMHIVYDMCVQIGPDNYVTRPRVMNVTPLTTIQEVLDWHDTQDRNNRTPSFHLVVER